MDNSEWLRNGDYVPTRMEALQDAANMVAGAKMQSNPESTVGVMTLAGRGPEVLVSPTEDMGKIMNAVHDVAVFGQQPTLSDGIQVAALALKHRKNKNGGQRIVVFVASPITDTPQSLTKVGKQLKKNNIAVDVVSFGETEDNQEKLESLIQAVNNESNSTLVVIPCGCVPVDVLVTSPIVNENMMGGGTHTSTGGEAASTANGLDDFGGVDPNMDPELAMALRVSMEEERARQEAAASAQNTGATMSDDGPAPLDTLGGSEPTDSTPQPAPLDAPASDAQAPSAQQHTMDDEEDEDALLQQALALSMADNAAMDDDDDDDIQKALQMSMASSETPQEPPASTPPQTLAPSPTVAPPAATPAVSAQFYDPSFVSSMLASLPGVDPNDPRIQQALQQIQAKQDSEKKEDEKGNK